jgi:solute:Na+ symporter, SSS family
LPEAVWRNPDQIFPYFLAHVFPTGVVGLVVAAILAAALGSIAGAINSLTAVAMVDFYKRIRLGERQPGQDPSLDNGRRDVLVSRVITLAVGILGTIVSCNVARMGTIFEIANKVINGFTGPLLGIFLLGMFTRRANSAGAFAGGFVGTAVTLYTIHLSNVGAVSFLWPSTFGLVATLAVGYVVSVLWGLSAAKERPVPSQSSDYTWAAIMRSNGQPMEASLEGCE